MFTLNPGDALDYAAVFEDAAEELHILGKLVPPHHQYTESADEVWLSVVVFFYINSRFVVCNKKNRLFVMKSNVF